MPAIRSKKAGFIPIEFMVIENIQGTYSFVDILYKDRTTIVPKKQNTLCIAEIGFLNFVKREMRISYSKKIFTERKIIRYRYRNSVSMP